MSQQLNIGIDLMGSDNAPEELFEALKELSLSPEISLCVIGPSSLKEEAESFRMQYVCADECIGMDEHPLLSLRRKKNASIPVGMRLLKEGKIDAFVSAGNTGALVSSAKMIVGPLPKILRPALLAFMPTKKKPVAVLDVGATVQIKALHLIQFALLGALIQKLKGIKNPKIGLLNIGSEPLKGTSELRIAYHELSKSKDLHFAGNIEGKTVFDGDVDVLVTDGFTGNVFLKTAEGIASLILDQEKKGEAKKFHSLHYGENPGALLAGIRGVVIKCHGYSSPKDFIKGVWGAIHLVKDSFVQKMIKELSFYGK